MKGFSEQVWTVLARAMTAAAFVMLIVVLAGCSLPASESKVIEKVVVIRPKVPKSLIDCDSDKPIYRHQTVTLKKAFAFTDEAMKWGERCSSENKAIGKIVEVE
ncbi:hypothetical protein [Agrobacterium sp. B1(2019)]|uniref:hypothetical protein n=1 Tax=Agrobacterium sp. B1(2019) TaxID=2607032 RepID=UPI0011EDB65E|nr:hypothetical protein [Agrobacterium sp. B1(2019)]TZG36622.1 hypothetical protein AGR1_03750 [Agrobacterium sp. B1(2019)]